MLFLFMVYVLIGWIWEPPYVSIKEKRFINRGFLKGPYIPIYGFAFLTIVYSMKIFENMSNSIFTILVQIAFICVVSAIWEYFTSLGLEVVFKTRWWDYSNRKFNIDGRIALDYTVLFGIGGFLVWRFVNPVFENMYGSLSYNTLLIIVITFYSIFMIDNLFTFRDMFKLRNIILKLDLIRKEFSGKYDYIFEHVYKGIQMKADEFKSSLGEYKNSLSKELSIIRNKGGEKLAQSIENKANQLNNLVGRSKNLSRFFNKYPKSPSRSYAYLIKVLRNK